MIDGWPTLLVDPGQVAIEAKGGHGGRPIRWAKREVILMVCPDCAEINGSHLLECPRYPQAPSRSATPHLDAMLAGRRAPLTEEDRRDLRNDHRLVHLVAALVHGGGSHIHGDGELVARARQILRVLDAAPGSEVTCATGQEADGEAAYEAYRAAGGGGDLARVWRSLAATDQRAWIEGAHVAQRRQAAVNLGTQAPGCSTPFPESIARRVLNILRGHRPPAQQEPTFTVQEIERAVTRAASEELWFRAPPRDADAPPDTERLARTAHDVYQRAYRDHCPTFDVVTWEDRPPPAQKAWISAIGAVLAAR